MRGSERGGEATRAGLAQRVEALAGAMPGTSRTEANGTVTWSIGGVAFATLTGDTVELRLDQPVARAATRTPDTTPSRRGQEWIRFAPSELDGPAVDRLEAWFAFARRRAAEGRQAD